MHVSLAGLITTSQVNLPISSGNLDIGTATSVDQT